MTKTKSTLSKIVAFLLVALLLMGGMSLQALAAPADNYYGRQLGESFQAELYESLENEVLANGTKTVTHIFIDKPLINQTNNRAIEDTIRAFYYDHPELYWINFELLDSTTTDLTHILQVTYTFNDFITPAPTGYSASRTTALDNAVDSIVAAANTGTTDYEKLLIAHNRIAAAVSYDETLSRPSSHVAAGALVDGTAVCEGYAKAFKLVADRLGYENILVGGLGSGQNHMWNYVELDGSWYAIDITWDDQDTTLTDFFLVGANTISTNIETGKTFSQSHTPRVFGITLSYPTLADEKYVPTGGGVTPPVDPTIPVDPSIPVDPKPIKPPTVVHTSSSSSSSSDNTGSSKADGSSVSGVKSSTSSIKTTTEKPSAHVGANGIVSSSSIITELTSQAKAGKTPQVTIKNASVLSSDALKAIRTTTSTLKNATIFADTTAANGAVEGRLYLTEDVLKSLPEAGIKLGVETNAVATKAAETAFAKIYSNKNAVVHLSQSGRLSVPMKIAVKVDTAGLNTKSLKFFVFDSETKAYVEIIAPAYFIDTNGYVHFYTTILGDVIITDSPLAKK